MHWFCRPELACPTREADESSGSHVSGRSSKIEIEEGVHHYAGAMIENSGFLTLEILLRTSRSAGEEWSRELCSCDM
jgi:hypothetical protein